MPYTRQKVLFLLKEAFYNNDPLGREFREGLRDKDCEWLITIAERFFEANANLPPERREPEWKVAKQVTFAVLHAGCG